MIVYLARDIRPFVMYCVNGKPRSSLLIESTDSMICIYYYLLLYIYIFIFFLPSLCNIFGLYVVKFGYWVCGESWHAMKYFNAPPQFSRLGTWCPNLFCTSVWLSPVCTGWRDRGRRVATYFFAFFSILLSIFFSILLSIFLG